MRESTRRQGTRRARWNRMTRRRDDPRRALPHNAPRSELSMATRLQRPAEKRSASMSARAPSRGQKLLPWAIVGGLLLALGIVYAQTLEFGFLDYDDPAFVRNAPQVTGG